MTMTLITCALSLSLALTLPLTEVERERVQSWLKTTALAIHTFTATALLGLITSGALVVVK